MKNLFVAIFSLMFIFSYAQEEYTILYVGPGQQFELIQDALDYVETYPNLIPCHIRVYPGTYYENIVWPNIDDIKCIGYHGTPIINGQIQSMPTVSFGSGLTNLTELRNFKITGGSGFYDSWTDVTYGGGVYIAGIKKPGCSPVLLDLEIYGNEADYGAGIWIGYYSNPRLWNCEVFENSGDYGGGIGFGEPPGWLPAQGTVNLGRTKIYNNSAIRGAGIWAHGISGMTEIIISRCLIDGNIANKHGGGIYVHSESDFTILNTIISNNDANGSSSTGNGGGIYGLSFYWTEINIEIENCTFADNSCTDQQGGAAIHSGEQTFNADIVSSIFWDNLADGYPNNFATTSANFSVEYSNIEEEFPGIGNIEEDPLFVADDCCDYELEEYSPCIDVGNPGEVLYTHDYCGNTRVINGGIAYRVDMGAFEYGKGGGSSHGLKNASIENESDMGYKIQNHPNPASSYTNFAYSIPEDTYVSISIYNLNGQLIKSLVNEYKNAGSYTIKWDTKDEQGIELLKGMYLYRFETPRHTQTQKLIVQ